LLSREWLIANIPKISADLQRPPATEEPNSNSDASCSFTTIDPSDDEHDFDSFSNVDKPNEPDYASCEAQGADNNAAIPQELVLSDDEKFRDEDGTCIPIEVRGEREVEAIYFRASDVGKMLKLRSIRNIFLDSRYHEFDENVEFVRFKNPQENANKPFLLFLTYIGLVRLLFIRKHPIAKAFQVSYR
jgi:hypothetical protein